MVLDGIGWYWMVSAPSALLASALLVPTRAAPATISKKIMVLLSFRLAFLVHLLINYLFKFCVINLTINYYVLI